jgi:hypothetical protein
MGWQGTDPYTWVIKAKDASRNAINKAARTLFSNISIETPVSDGIDGQGRIIKDNGTRHTGGQALHAWLPTTDHPADSIPTKKDASGNETLEKIKLVCESAKGDQSLFLTNNLPYIKSLEFGWYGKWEGGSFTPATTRKVIGGYSRQAPAGMMEKNIAKWDDILDAAVKSEK